MPNCSSCGAPTEAPNRTCRACGEDTTRGDLRDVTDELPPPADEFSDLLALDEMRQSGDGDMPIPLRIETRLEYAAAPRSAEPIVHLLVDVTPEAPAGPREHDRPVAHVILLLDVSASMDHDDKYPVLKEALARMLADLAAPGSAPVLISIVLFAYGAKTLLRDVPASRLNPADVLARIDASPLLFGRYTDVVGALKRAGKIAIQQLGADRSMPVRIYVLTDGKPQDLDRMRKVMERISRLPVDVDGFAFGADADVDLLQEMVSGGRGGTVKQVRAETIGDAFDRIGVVAQRIVSNRSIVELELGDGVVGRSAYRYRPGRHRWPEDAFVDGAIFRTDLGALESGRTYSLLFELRLPETVALRTTVGKVSVRLRGEGPGRYFECPVSIPRTPGDDLPEPDHLVVAARDVLASLSGNDPKMHVRALRIRRKLYVAERRDPHLLEVIDKAIVELEQRGNLHALSAAERALLRAHTATVVSMPPPGSREMVG